ncbi:unnamed protein product [Caenorhabditis bovis]|uniref:Tumor protein p53-inducible protein 11 n=1 Tax=Caenorhabditis bovis TaxID=2654633 RepID=A0A8S1EMA8_9PELO|nr:unnamed protein product [Caenorhabditis bovis]
MASAIECDVSTLSIEDSTKLDSTNSLNINDDKIARISPVDDPNVVSRKQSASDLQSRLKTRKLLGVGELAGDNGEVYKSKISQLLGINESLYVRLPRGMLYWNSFNTLYFLMLGALFVFIPYYGSFAEFGTGLSTAESYRFARLYGIMMFAFGTFFKYRYVLQQRETRAEIATLLLVTAALHMAQFTVMATMSGEVVWWALTLKGFCVAGNMCYHTLVDGQGGIHRQFFRVFEECSFLSTSPVVEKKPIIGVQPTESASEQEAKKNE